MVQITSATWPPAVVRSADIVTMLREECRLDEDRPVLMFDDGLVVSSRELTGQFLSFAGYLLETVAPGDRLLLVLGNRAEFIVAALGAVAARNVFVGVNPAHTLPEFRTIVDDCTPRLLVTDQEGADRLSELIGTTSLEHLVVVGDTEPFGLSGHASAGLTLADLVGDPQDLVSIQYTSGTSGTPKGCLYDHGPWLRFADLYLRCFGLESTDRFFSPLSFCYEDAFWQLLATLKAGSVMVATRKFSASRFWETVRSCGATQAYGGGAMSGLLLKQEPSTSDREHALRFVAGAEFPMDQHRALVDRWGVPWRELYGLTEGGILTAMPADRADEMVGRGSIGLTCPEIDLRIVDEDDRDVAPGEEGEIIVPVNGPGVFRGYLNHPEATEERFRGGWLRTGDIARRDEEGFVYFIRRSKAIIRRSAQNISIAEIEALLRTHPLIADAAAMPEKDDLRGEEVRVFVQPAPDAGELTEQDVVAYCRHRLAAYKVPRYVQFFEEFPRTPTFRPIRSELVRLAKERGMPLWDRTTHLDS